MEMCIDMRGGDTMGRQQVVQYECRVQGWQKGMERGKKVNRS